MSDSIPQVNVEERDSSKKKTKKKHHRDEDGEASKSHKKNSRVKKQPINPKRTHVISSNSLKQSAVRAEDHSDEDDRIVDVKEEDTEEKLDTSVPIAALAEFAHPLADEKYSKKILAGVFKAARKRSLYRGAKESVKALRKLKNPKAPKSSSTLPPALAVFCGDVSPSDVISHFPVLCEDIQVPYVFLKNRNQLGLATMTKRPCTVALIQRDMSEKARFFIAKYKQEDEARQDNGGKKRRREEGDDEDQPDGRKIPKLSDAEWAEERKNWGEEFKSLIKTWNRAERHAVPH